VSQKTIDTLRRQMPTTIAKGDIKDPPINLWRARHQHMLLDEVLIDLVKDSQLSQGVDTRVSLTSVCNRPRLRACCNSAAERNRDCQRPTSRILMCIPSLSTSINLFALKPLIVYPLPRNFICDHYSRDRPSNTDSLDYRLGCSDYYRAS
jgi:hypothetical protein